MCTKDSNRTPAIAENKHENLCSEPSHEMEIRRSSGHQGDPIKTLVDLASSDDEVCVSTGLDV